MRGTKLCGPAPTRDLSLALRAMAGVSLGVALFGLSNGGNFALVAIGMSQSGASDSLVGLATSTYFTGTLAASLTSGAIVGRVGHGRAFLLAAFLAFVSTAALATVERSVIWPFVRAVTGYGIGMYYVVVESWFNYATNNRTRGRMLAFYETVRICSVAVGSFVLISLHGSIGISVFIAAGALYLVAVVPVSMNRLSVPTRPPGERRTFRILPLIRKAPLGLACCLVGGLTTAAIYGLVPLYAQKLGLDSLALSSFVFLSHFGAFFFQLPSGILADRIGRNATILLLCLVSALAAALLGFSMRLSLPTIMGAGAVVGGICHTVFTLGAVYTNDQLDPKTYTAGAAALLVAYDVGTVLGPFGASAAMETMGAGGLYVFIAVFMGALSALAAHRCWREGAGLPADRLTGD